MNNDAFIYIISFGTVGLMLIAFSIIIFVIFYQRKIFAKQNLIVSLEQENQRALLDAVLTTKEKEQKRIAQELHDEIGSSINAVKMSLIHLDLEEDQKNKLNNELLQISKNVRRISNELLPSVLDELGIHIAIEHLVNKFKSSDKLQFEIIQNLSEAYPLEKSVELSIYRILQELINNISKYADASNVSINIEHTDSNLTIILSDDGNGFIPSQLTIGKKDSLGLKNIISRLQQINGTSSYKMNVPKGSIVTIEILKE